MSTGVILSKIHSKSRRRWNVTLRFLWRPQGSHLRRHLSHQTSASAQPSPSSRPRVPPQPASSNPLWHSSGFRRSRRPFRVYANLLKSRERQDVTRYQYQQLKSEDYSIVVPKLCTETPWGAAVNHRGAVWCFKETKATFDVCRALHKLLAQSNSLFQQ